MGAQSFINSNSVSRKPVGTASRRAYRPPLVHPMIRGVPRDSNESSRTILKDAVTFVINIAVSVRRDLGGGVRSLVV